MEKLVEWTFLAGETEALRENLPRRHFVHHKYHLPGPGAYTCRRGGKPETNRFSYGAAIGHLQNVTTNNYNSYTELHTPNITVTTSHTKSSQFAVLLPVVSWWRIPAITSASVPTFLLAGDCLTANPLHQLLFL
jgi:hypothetical protein